MGIDRKDWAKGMFMVSKDFVANTNHKPELDKLYAQSEVIADEIQELGKAAPQELKRELRAILARTERIAALRFFAAAAHGFTEFDVDKLSDESLVQYAKMVRKYNATKNNYFALEAYLLAFGSLMSPPMWVTTILGLGFAEFLFGDNPPTLQSHDDIEPTKLPKCLNLMPTASGGSNPLAEYQRHYHEIIVMSDILHLVSELGLSESAACKAVIIKHDLTESVSTLKRRLPRHLGFLYSSIKTDHPITSSASFTEYDRVKFIDSFPPKAKTIIRKSCSR